MIERGIAPVAARLSVDWSGFRKCPTCDAAAGAPCESMFERIHNGRPTGDRVQLEHAHAFRQRRRSR